MSGNAKIPTSPQNSLGNRQLSWGVGDAALGWIASQFYALAAFSVVASMGFSLIAPKRPGGFLGRAVGQNRIGGEFVDESLPLVWQMLVQVPGWIVMLGVTWVFAGFAGKQRPGWTLKGKPLDVVRGFVVGFVLQIPIVAIVVALMTLILGELIPTGRPQALVDSIDTTFDLVALIGVVAIGAPVVEELFYRGVVQRSLVERFGPVIGIAIASLVFGAVHTAWVDLLPLTVVGAGFGILAHRYGRLLPAIVAHMTFNSIVLVVLLSS